MAAPWAWWLVVTFSPDRYSSMRTVNWGPYASQEQAAGVSKQLARRRSVERVAIEVRSRMVQEGGDYPAEPYK